MFAAFKPSLFVPALKADDAVKFYKGAFGAEELNRASHPMRKADQESPLVLCADLKIGDAFFSVCDVADDSTVRELELRLTAPPSSSPEQAMNQRGGSVLGKRSILNSDHFPGCQNKRLTPHIDGAPNYPQVGSLSVHGVVIPMIAGIRNVLDHIRAKTKKVLWHNLREEPVVYINGRPFVLRDVERPFSNLEYTLDTRLHYFIQHVKEDLIGKHNHTKDWKNLFSRKVGPLRKFPCDNSNPV